MHRISICEFSMNRKMHTHTTTARQRRRRRKHNIWNDKSQQQWIDEQKEWNDYFSLFISLYCVYAYKFSAVYVQFHFVYCVLCIHMIDILTDMVWLFCATHHFTWSLVGILNFDSCLISFQRLCICFSRSLSFSFLCTRETELRRWKYVYTRFFISSRWIVEHNLRLDEWMKCQKIEY